MVSTRSKTGATPARSPVKTISKKRHPKPADTSPRDAAPHPFPDVSLHTDSGAIISTHSLLSDATPGLILFTYPRANTGGCTTQAKGLSALRSDALAAGYSIVGCSYDSVKSQAAWKVKSSIPLTLLSDTPSSGLLRKLAVHKPPRSVKRSVFVIVRDGGNLHIVFAKRAVSPKDSIALMEQYISDNPLDTTADNSNLDHDMAVNKPQPAAAATTDDAGDKPQDKQPAEQHVQKPDQSPAAAHIANHADAGNSAPHADAHTDKVATEPAGDQPAAENPNPKPVDAPKPPQDANSNKPAEQSQPTPDPKPAEHDPSAKVQKDTPEDKPSTVAVEKPVVMDVEKPQEEIKA